MRSPIIISIVNHKGGCFKTTVTVNLGAALAARGKRVLVVDLDAQQNLTQSLVGQVEVDAETPTLLDHILERAPLDSLIVSTGTPGVDLIPCAEDFAMFEMNIINEVSREYALRDCFSKTAALSNYDFVLLDNPPSIAMIVVNSLAASDYFLVPCSAEYLPMTGLTLLGNSIGKLERVAPQLQPLGVVLTNYASTETICKQVEKMLESALGDRLFKTKIRVNTKAKACPGKRQTIFQYEKNPQGRGTEDYLALADEFLMRVGAVEGVDVEKKIVNG